MTSSNGNISRVTGPLFGEFTGQCWIPLTKASNAANWDAGDLSKSESKKTLFQVGTIKQ